MVSLWIICALQLVVLAVAVAAAAWLKLRLIRFESRCHGISLANLRALSDVLDNALLQARALRDSLRNPESAVADFVREFEEVAAERRAQGQPALSWLDVLAESDRQDTAGRSRQAER